MSTIQKQIKEIQRHDRLIWALEVFLLIELIIVLIELIVAGIFILTL